MKIRYGRKSFKRTFRNVFLTTLSVVVLVPLVTAVSYVGYVMGTYYRIGDIPLTINEKSNLTTIKSNQEMTITTYNIGFGAYSDDYTFLWIVAMMNLEMLFPENMEKLDQKKK